MKYRKFVLFTFFTVFFLSITNLQAQAKKIADRTPISNSNSIAQAVKSSSAYAEVLLRKTERTAELEDLLIEYTEDFPKVKELRYELDLINKEMNRITSVNATEAGKLTLALGKLMMRKVELEVEYWNLQKQYNDEHPDVKQAKRKVDVFEAAIKDILQ